MEKAWKTDINGRGKGMLRVGECLYTSLKFMNCWHHFYHSAEATITKHHQLSGLNNRKISSLFCVLEVCAIMASLWRRPSSCLVDGCLLSMLPGDLFFVWERGGGAEGGNKEYSGTFSLKDTNSVGSGSHSYDLI